MTKSIDQQLIAGFVGEAKSYIPKIESAIETLRGGADSVTKIEEMHRYIQNIKGASSMIGVNELSDISNYMEKILEDLASDKVKFSEDVLLFLRNTITHIGNYLDSLIEGEFDYKTVLNEVENSYRRLVGDTVTTNQEAAIRTVKTEQTDISEHVSDSISKVAQQKVQYPENEPVLAKPLEIYREILNNFKILQDSPDKFDEIPQLLEFVSRLTDLSKRYQFSPYNKATKALNYVSTISHKLHDVVKDLDYNKSSDNYTTLLGITETFIYQIERVLYNYSSDIDFNSEVEQLISNYAEYTSSVLKVKEGLQTSELPIDKSVDKHFSPELISEFLQETAKDAIEIGNLFATYEGSNDKESVLKSVKSYIHKINGAAGMLGSDKPSEEDTPGRNHAIFRLTSDMSDYLNLLAETGLQLNEKSLQLTTEGAEFLKVLCEQADIEGLDENINKINLRFSTAIEEIGKQETSLPLITAQDSEIRTTTTDKPQRPKIPDELYEVFTIEAKEHIENMNNCLADFAAKSDDLSLLQEVRRGAHTIKGAAGMVGLQTVSDLGHEMEAVLDNLFDSNILPSLSILEIFTNTTKILEKLISTEDSTDLDNEFNDILNQYKQLESLDIASMSQADTKSYSDETIVPAEDQTVISEIKEQDAQPVEEQYVFSTELSEDIPPDLLEVFLVEANEHLQNISRFLNLIAKDFNDRQSLQEIRRSVHTIKGAAGMVGFAAVSSLAHSMEDLLDDLYEKSVIFSDNILNLLYKTSDLLDDIINSKVTDHHVNKLLTDMFDEYKEYVKDEELEFDQIAESEIIDATEGFKEEDVFLGLDSEEIFELDQTPVDPPQRTEQTIRKPGDFVRIPMERLDELVNLVSELVVNRSTFEQHFGVFNQELDEMAPSLDRLRRVTSNLETQYEVLTLGGGKLQIAAGAEGNVTNFPVQTSKSHGFDELELDRYTEFHQYTRELSESTSDIRAIGGQMADLTGDFESYLNRQSRITSEVQDKLMRLRMVPFATVATRLHRAVRVTASQQNKKVNLSIHGEDVELDKTVLEEMSDPLLHIIRNSVDNGIELAELRKALNKNEVGTISLRAYYEGTQVVIRIGDDGAGLVPEVLRTAAVRGGFVAEADSYRLSEEDLYNLIFLPGFTSATEISEISGRGVGMDIVNDTVNKLKGTITIDSVPAKGVTFTIRLPMTLAITRVLLVYSNNEQFAVPLASVSQIMRVEKEYIESLGDETVLKIENNIYPIIRLGEVLNLKTFSSESIEGLPVLLMNLGEQHIALVVDELLESKEVVVKTLGSHLKNVHGITGATLMGDGSVVLIVNPSDLIEEPGRSEKDVHVPVSTELRRDILDVFIIDDSLSVRRIMSNLIKNNGWNPIVAKDGVEALEILQRSIKLPDVILLDIEMPRMDGYELTSTLRAQQQFKDIPIIMVTSRSGKKHRDKAFELGANDYMVKPYQEEDLVALIKQITGSKSDISLQ